MVDDPAEVVLVLRCWSCLCQKGQQGKGEPCREENFILSAWLLQWKIAKFADLWESLTYTCLYTSYSACYFILPWLHVTGTRGAAAEKQHKRCPLSRFILRKAVDVNPSWHLSLRRILGCIAISRTGGEQVLFWIYRIDKNITLSILVALSGLSSNSHGSYSSSQGICFQVPVLLCVLLCCYSDCYHIDSIRARSVLVFVIISHIIGLAWPGELSQES